MNEFNFKINKIVCKQMCSFLFLFLESVLWWDEALPEFFMSYFISPRVLSMNVSLFKAILTCYLILF